MCYDAIPFQVRSRLVYVLFCCACISLQLTSFGQDSKISDAKPDEEKRKKASPGGLEPEEVFNALPKEMQEAFESREISRLQECATTMDYKDFKYHYERLVYTLA